MTDNEHHDMMIEENQRLRAEIQELKGKINELRKEAYPLLSPEQQELLKHATH